MYTCIALEGFKGQRHNYVQVHVRMRIRTYMKRTGWKYYVDSLAQCGARSIGTLVLCAHGTCVNLTLLEFNA